MTLNLYNLNKINLHVSFFIYPLTPCMVGTNDV